MKSHLNLEPEGFWFNIPLIPFATSNYRVPVKIALPILLKINDQLKNISAMQEAQITTVYFKTKKDAYTLHLGVDLFPN